MDSVDAKPSLVEISARTWLLRVRLPGHSFGSVNAYLLDSDDGAVLIDVPWGTPDTYAELLAQVRAAGVEPAALRYVLLTHHHDDHAGAAGLLQSEYGVRVAMHAAEWRALRARFEDGGGFAHVLQQWLSRVGADPAGAEFALRQYAEIASRTRPVRPDVVLADDEVVSFGGRRIRVVHAPGHTPGHTCYLDEDLRLLFSGDHVFASRRANATSRPYAPERPLKEYWASTERLLALEPAVVLPGHDDPFDDLAARMRVLRAVYDEKRSEVTQLATTRSTAWQIAARMRRRRAWSELDGNARLAATGEAEAYLLDALDAEMVTATKGRPVLWQTTSGVSG
ncbi:MBL fold metallo-hydrolase [Actinopolymorpha alba]|uniref:MBL fold metallo-hydrolase n=1 Tax=Actinopolymorpha alba TaxID=533267 RepID=UPI0003673DC6|nr:MBL fold metallo-hydrolase [Actinopolymorpha alba]